GGVDQYPDNRLRRPVNDLAFDRDAPRLRFFTLRKGNRQHSVLVGCRRTVLIHPTRTFAASGQRSSVNPPKAGYFRRLGVVTVTIMNEARSYHRGLYRLPISCPAMYCLSSIVGEGRVTNLSAIGCTLETREPLPPNHALALRLLLPDRPDSLPIETAIVRWVRGTKAGIEFTKINRAADLRLHAFVWDKMVERIHEIQLQQSVAE
ncbi:MAG TPA: PilZ domain-containing protein, partial [Nitrospira sp.]|nr:PilZ domain-containing protein [Nitrospira sp.]